MSTKINVIVGDQRLLQDNKTRAAANQQALDSRTQQQQLEQQATNAVEEASPEESASDVPSLLQERRPAAQRRKKEEIQVGFIGADKLVTRYLPETRVDYRQEWEENYFYRVLNSFGAESIFTLVNPRVNTYTYYTGGLHPFFNLVEKKSKTDAKQKTTFLNFPSYPVYYDIAEMDFTVRTLNFIETRSVGNRIVRQIASTAPALPLDITSIKRTRTIYTSFNCNSGKIYYSTLLRIYKASDTVIENYSKSDFYHTRTNIFNVGIIGLSTGVFFSLKSPGRSVPPISSSEPPTDFIYTQLNYRNSAAYLDVVRSLPYDYKSGFAAYDDIGIYTVYDLNTNTTTTRNINISELVKSDPSLSAYYDVTEPANSVGPLYYFLYNLDAQDPEYEFFLEYIRKFGGTDVFIKGQANRYRPTWPRYAYYDRKKRIVYIMILGDRTLPRKRDVWRYKFTASEPADTYSQVRNFLLSLSSFTKEDLERRGFQYLDSVDVDFEDPRYRNNVPVVKVNGKF
jgi:hypothetical protein